MSNDPLGALIEQSPILASISAVLLLLCCASLVAFWRLRLRLAAMQTQLDGRIRKVEAFQEGVLLRFLNLPTNQSEENNFNGTPPHPSAGNGARP